MPTINLTLTRRDELIARLRLQDNPKGNPLDNKIKIIECLEAFRRGIEDRIQRGIDFPTRSQEAHLNAKPDDGIKLLQKIGELYQRMYRFSFEITELKP